MVRRLILFAFAVSFFLLSYVQAGSLIFFHEAQNNIPAVELETNQYFYTSQYRESNFEQRYSLSVKAYSEKDQDFQYGLASYFWKLEPSEVAQWFEVSELFVGFQTPSWQVKLGRVLPQWGNLHSYSPVLKNFPYFSLDPLSNIQEGLVGAYFSYRGKKTKVEFLLSPLFIPLLGGPRLEGVGEDHLEVWSRWLPPLLYRAKMGGGILPVDYTVTLPKIVNVLFQNGAIVRWGAHNEVGSFSVHAASVINPSPRIRIEEKLVPHKPELRAYLSPEFHREEMIGLDGQINFLGGSFFSEASYVRPRNPHSLLENMYKNASFKTLLGIKIANASWLPHWIAGLSYEKILGQKTVDSTPGFLPHKSPFLFFTSLNLKPFHWSELGFMTETDSEFKEGVLRGSFGFFTFDSFSLSLGLDVLWGEDDTYWGQFRAHDRMWLKGTYVF
ncbi:MAG: hypothetical protein HYW47_00315 [Deltaproteobacteria bacterium]|nr:hypothetical protein [Deltaproteobacteria bacterium]